MKKNAKIKVLQITSGFRKGVSGGIPSVLYNYCTAPAFDDDDVGFDFLALGYQTFEPYRVEIEEHGGELYNLGIHSAGMMRNLQIFIELKKFLEKSKLEYDIVHINSGALVQVLVAAFAARFAGIKCIIIHSHNAIIKAKSREIIYRFLKPLFYLCADKYFACAEMAADSMFPKRILKEHKWVMVPNAIEVDRFVYNEEIRKQYRKEYGLEGKYVIGHVGRFNEQKNHKFLLDIFAKVCQKRDNVMLLLVGTGELKTEIEDKAKALGIEKKVLFVGQRRDVNCFMQAMDIFVFPSYYEGLGMVLIEAQASGMHVISSDRVPQKETQITDNIQYLPLEDSEKWEKEIYRALENNNRLNRRKELLESGYELKIAANNLKRIYKSYFCIV